MDRSPDASLPLEAPSGARGAPTDRGELDRAREDRRSARPVRRHPRRGQLPAQSGAPGDRTYQGDRPEGVHPGPPAGTITLSPAAACVLGTRPGNFPGRGLSNPPGPRIWSRWRWTTMTCFFRKLLDSLFAPALFLAAALVPA